MSRSHPNHRHFPPGPAAFPTSGGNRAGASSAPRGVLLWLAAFVVPVLPPPAGAAEPPERIVSIGGAATEIVHALGMGGDVVAVDLSSTYPPEVRQLPQVGYVRSISPEGVLSMEPDLIVATGALGPPAARSMMERLDVRTIWLPDPASYEDLAVSVRRVGAALGREKEAGEILESVEEDLAAAREKASRWENRKPTVVFFLEPPGAGGGGMAGGRDSRADALIRLAGGENAADGFSGFQPVSRESLLAMDPDVILVAESEGHGGSPASIRALKESAALSRTNAVRTGAVHGVPLDDLAFGPRLGEAALRWNALLAAAAEGGEEPDTGG
ncbi:MAG: hemin ABC transporter substrate-binding protein [Puniceicoccaceae bacterium]